MVDVGGQDTGGMVGAMETDGGCWAPDLSPEETWWILDTENSTNSVWKNSIKSMSLLRHYYIKYRY
jgi:hypothetical protein